MIFLKRKFYIIFFSVIITGVFCYQYFFVKDFKRSYRQNGQFAVGKIKDVRGYGRGAGFNYIYTFNVKGKIYECVCDVGKLPYAKARKKVNNNFLVIYLKDDIYNNRIYSNIPINGATDDVATLKRTIDNSPVIKSKIDSIPAPGYFFQNYF